MASKGLTAQRDDLVLVQLEHISSTVARLETALTGVVADLGTVRIAELAAIRETVSELAGELRGKVAALETALRDRIATVDTKVEVLQYQARRSGATAGAWISAVISVLVAAAGALLLRHP